MASWLVYHAKNMLEDGNYEELRLPRSVEADSPEEAVQKAGYRVDGGAIAVIRASCVNYFMTTQRVDFVYEPVAHPSY